MDEKRRIGRFFVPALVIMLVAGCVSKEQYLLEVEGGRRLSAELKDLRAQYAQLRRERRSQRVVL